MRMGLITTLPMRLILSTPRFLAALIAANFPPAMAQTVAEQPTTLEPVSVIGDRDAAWEMPGSANYITAEEFRRQGYLNFAKVAAQIPGLYVREEDGYGNFINVSLRGVDGTRSSKVTLMEDGILTAPSPYSAPAAYYSPKLGRMAGVEVLKGSSQIAFGPHTTGGVVNFLSTPVPDSEHFFLRTTGGIDNTGFVQANYGRSFQSDAGRVGFLVEFHGQTTDGYRSIDGSDRDSGFEVAEPMLKLFWEPATRLRQRLELKVGYTRFDANESYSGITEADLRANPDRRYAASQFDHMESDHWRTYLKHIAQPSEALRIETAAYYNTFERSWDKLDGLSGQGLRTNVAQALLHAPSLAVLQGFGTGSIVTRDGYRDHTLMGIQTQADFRFDTQALAHTVTAGVRVHQDEVTGYNQGTTYASNGLGGFGPGTRAAAVSIGEQEVLAAALHIEDRIEIGRLMVRPGIRYEGLEWSNTPNGGTETTGDEALVTAGVGATWDLTERTSLLGGIYQGASPSNPAGYATGTRSERSLGYEFGVRHRVEAVQAEVIGFLTEFERLIAPQVGIGSGGVLPSPNAGEARSYGLESILEVDWGLLAGLEVGLPLRLSGTWTQAEFTGLPENARLGNSAGVFAGAINGNEIPYIPEWKVSGGFGIVAKRWGLRVDVSYVGESWGSGYNETPRLNDGSSTVASPSTLDGRIDSLLLVDFAGHIQMHDRVKLVAGVQNAFDERGIISRLPLGPRANSPRFPYAGVEVEF